MSAKRAAQSEELESRHADALGDELRVGSAPGQMPHSALADVTTGGPYLDDTVGMLGQVDKRAEELARSVDAMLHTLSTKMGDIAHTSKEHSVAYDNLVNGTEQSIEFAMMQMGSLISKCKHLEMELAPVDDMAPEIQSIKAVLSQLEKALAQTVLRKR
jgi:hypothetical protein